MSNPRRRRKFKDDTSAGERAWLTGDGIEQLSAVDGYMYWCLCHGFLSHYKGKARSARQLADEYAALIPDERRIFIDACIDLYDKRAARIPIED